MAKQRPTNRLPLFAGCNYVVGQGHKGKHSFNIFCNKLTESGSQYCPKHVLYAEDDAKAIEHRAFERRRIKEQRAAELDALALSPLRAHNPAFDEKGDVDQTYTDGGTK